MAAQQQPSSAPRTAAQDMEDRDRAFLERIEKKQGFKDMNWTNMWPIAVAPSIPLVGIAFRNNKKVRNLLIGVIGTTVLVGAHSAALSTSTFSK